MIECAIMYNFFMATLLVMSLSEALINGWFIVHMPTNSMKLVFGIQLVSKEKVVWEFTLARFRLLPGYCWQMTKLVTRLVRCLKVEEIKHFEIACIHIECKDL